MKIPRQRSSLLEWVYMLTNWVSTGSLMVFYFSSMIGICIVIWQVFHWLKTGVWIPVPLSKVLITLEEDLSSAYHPQSWIGVAKIAQWFLKQPASLCVPITSGILFLLCLLAPEPTISESYKSYMRRKVNQQEEYLKPKQKGLSGWYRFIIFSGIWTIFTIILLINCLISTEPISYLHFSCFWLVPIGIAYLWGWIKDKGDTNDLSDYRKGTRNPD